MNKQQNQINRVLSMYDRLCKGHMLTKQAEADSFRVSEKTIQRDLNSIRTFLETTKTNQYLEYDRVQKAYKLEKHYDSLLKMEYYENYN